MEEVLNPLLAAAQIQALKKKKKYLSEDQWNAKINHQYTKKAKNKAQKKSRKANRK